MKGLFDWIASPSARNDEKGVARNGGLKINFNYDLTVDTSNNSVFGVAK